MSVVLVPQVLTAATLVVELAVLFTRFGSPVAFTVTEFVNEPVV